MTSHPHQNQMVLVRWCQLLCFTPKTGFKQTKASPVSLSLGPPKKVVTKRGVTTRRTLASLNWHPRAVGYCHPNALGKVPLFQHLDEKVSIPVLCFCNKSFDVQGLLGSNDCASNIKDRLGLPHPTVSTSDTSVGGRKMIFASVEQKV